MYLIRLILFGPYDNFLRWVMVKETDRRFLSKWLFRWNRLHRFSIYFLLVFGSFISSTIL